MENLLISACLLGFECKYSGGSNALDGEKLGSAYPEAAQRTERREGDK